MSVSSGKQNFAGYALQVPLKLLQRRVLVGPIRTDALQRVDVRYRGHLLSVRQRLGHGGLDRNVRHRDSVVL